jgi:hypothetical protein
VDFFLLKADLIDERFILIFYFFLLVSTFTKGEQMVPVLNKIGTHCAVFGNHDFGELTNYGLLEKKRKTDRETDRKTEKEKRQRDEETER